MVSKDLFLEVHTEVAKWRWLVLHWIRQLLRGHAPFDVARRLHYEMETLYDLFGIEYFRDRWIEDGVVGTIGRWKPLYSWWWNATYQKWSQSFPRL